jgi:hypothetical protein
MNASPSLRGFVTSRVLVTMLRLDIFKSDDVDTDLQ